MRLNKKLSGITLFTVLCLFFCGCADKVEELQPPSQSVAPPVSAAEQEWESPTASGGSGKTFVLSASFLREDGEAIANGSAHIAIGEDSARYSLNERGELRLSGLPRGEILSLLLLDKEERSLGSTTVSFSTGEVIDASTGQNGAAYVTMKSDTEEIALVFTLSGDGALQCSLLLLSSLTA